MEPNVLYAAVLPLIHLGVENPAGHGRTEEVLTLFPSREFATKFFSEEVDGFVATIRNRTKYLVGSHVKGYTISTEETDDGRFYIMVVQHVL